MCQISELFILWFLVKQGNTINNKEKAKHTNYNMILNKINVLSKHSSFRMNNFQSAIKQQLEIIKQFEMTKNYVFAYITYIIIH